MQPFRVGINPDILSEVDEDYFSNLSARSVVAYEMLV